MKRFSKFLTVLLVVSMILPGIAQAAPVVTAESSAVQRLAGKGREETAVAASEMAYKDGAENVVLVGYNGEVDALAGTLLANAKKAPLLITNQASLTETTKKEIARLKAKNVYILGGENVVSEEVEIELKALKYNVKRIEGADREKTAIAVAKEVGGTINHVFLAKGYDIYADALSVGPVSAIKNMPVFLTNTNSMTPATIQAMKDLGVKEVTIVGGEKTVTKKVEDQLKGIKINRISGDDRIKTALAVADKFFPSTETSILASGYIFADALVGGYIGAKMNAPILLTNTNLISAETEEFIADNSLKIYVLGGEKVVSDKVLKKIEAAVKAEKVSAISVEGTDKATTITTKGGTLQMIATVSPDNASNKSVTWSVENGTGEATIDADTGLLTAKGDGTVTVRATSVSTPSVSGTTEITISGQEVAPIEADLTAYTAALAAVEEADYTAESWTAYQVVVAANVMTVANTQAEVDAATAAITAAQAELVEVEPVEVSAININKSTTTLVEGTTETLTVTFTPSNASNKTITWTTSDASKATIDSTGKVRAVSAGTATITAKSNNGKTATCAVTVTTTVVPVSAISVEPKELTLTVGETGKITATVEPDNATKKDVTWESSDEDVATVDENGKVTAIGAGQATITVTTVDGEFTDTVQVVIGNVINLTKKKGYETIQKATEEIKDGDTLKLIANISTDKGITIDKNIIFDLNEKTITNSLDANKDGNENEIAIVVKSTVTVKNGTIITDKGSGGIQADGTSANLTIDGLTINQNGLNTKKIYNSTAVLAANEAKVTIISGDYTAETDAVLVKANGGTVIIEDGNFTAGRSAARNDAWGEPTHSLTINGGIFKAEKEKDSYALFSAGGNAETTVNGGIFNGEINSEYNHMIINDGTFDQTIFQGGGHQDYYTIYGGTFNDDLSGTLPKNTTVIRAKNPNRGKEYGTLQEAITDAESGDTINILNDSTIVGTTASNKNLTFVGNSSKPKVTFPQKGYQTYSGCEFTFENLTLECAPDENYQGIQPDKVIAKNCVINGKFWGYAKDLEFTDCVFNQNSSYNIWTYGSNVTFDNCEFNSAGRSVLIYNEGATKDIPAKITINNSKFINTGDVVSEKAAIEISTEHGGSFEVVINNSTAEGFDIKTATGGIVLSEGLANLKYIGTGTLTVTIDGKQVLADGLTYDADSDTYEISNANGLIYANKNLFNINLSNNKYKLGADIDMSDVTDWNSNVSQTTHFELDGGGYKISGLKTTSDALLVPRSQYTVTIKNLTLENCEVNTASEYAAMLVGYADANTVTIDNCNIINGKVQGANYAGALIGWSSKDININSSSVENTSILGGGSTGGIVGHCVGDESGIANITDVTIEDCTIKGEKVEKSGIVVGTANVGKTTITTNSIVNNTVFEIENSDAIYGRFVPSTTGELTVNSTTIN